MIGNPAKEITCHPTSPLTGIMGNVSIIIRAEQLFKALQYIIPSSLLVNSVFGFNAMTVIITHSFRLILEGKQGTKVL